MVVELHVELPDGQRATAPEDGLTVVLLHAFPLSAAMWQHQREALDSRAWVIAPDLRGFGRSPLGSEDPSVAAMANDIVAVLDRFGIERAVLVGLSMGGYIAMAVLRRHAARVRGLVLADTKASADAPAARDKRERIARAVLADGGGTVLREEVLPTLLGPTTERERPQVREQVLRMLDAAPPRAVAWAQRAMAARPDSFDVLRGSDVPGLVVVGAEDTLSPPEEAEQMAEALAGSELVVVPDAGHLSAVESPDRFDAALHTFVDRLSDPA